MHAYLSYKLHAYRQEFENKNTEEMNLTLCGLKSANFTEFKTNEHI